MHVSGFSRIALALTALFLVSCGHTDNLAKHNVRQSRMVFRSYATGIGGANAHLHPISHDMIGAIVAEVGSAAVEERVNRKLERAANPQALASSASEGIEENLRTFLGVIAVPDSAHFIVETVLTKYELESGRSGVHANIGAEARILSAATGEVVWEDKEEATVPLQRSVHAPLAPSVPGAVASAINAGLLADLTEEELAQMLDDAAQAAGRLIGETLREDIADMSR